MSSAATLKDYTKAFVFRKTAVTVKVYLGKNIISIKDIGMEDSTYEPTTKDSTMLVNLWVNVLQDPNNFPIDTFLYEDLKEANGIEKLILEAEGMTFTVFMKTGTLGIEGPRLHLWFKQHFREVLDNYDKEKTVVKDLPPHADEGHIQDSKTEPEGNQVDPDALVEGLANLTLDEPPWRGDIPEAELLTLNQGAVKGGQSYIYNLWKSLLTRWFSTTGAKVYLATPFLDADRLADVIEIFFRCNRGDLEAFYVRDKCDGKKSIGTVQKATLRKRKFSKRHASIKASIKDKIFRKMSPPAKYFHCKFAAAVRADGQAEVLVTSANFHHYHFGCNNMETVSFLRMSAADFFEKYVEPIVHGSEPDALVEEVPPHADEGHLQDSKTEPEDNQVKVDPDALVEGVANLTLGEPPWRGDIPEAELLTLHQGAVKDGQSYIYNLWKSLLTRWFSTTGTKVYLATPFLDAVRLADVIEIFFRCNQGDLEAFYVRDECDRKTNIGIVQKVALRKRKFSKRHASINDKIFRKMSSPDKRFHCKFAAAVRADGQAEVLVTSANFHHDHFGFNNMETVSFLRMSAADFFEKYVDPIVHGSEPDALVEEVPPHADEGHLQDSKTEPEDNQVKVDPDALVEGVANLTLGEPPWRGDIPEAELLTLHQGAVKDGQSYIYNLWKSLLARWFSTTGTKVYLATPFLDAVRLADVIEIFFRCNQGDLEAFYVRDECDRKKSIGIVQKVALRKRKFSKMHASINDKIFRKMLLLNKWFHCKFAAAVRADGQAEVLVTSANFHRNHFGFNNMETVSFLRMSAVDFFEKYVEPIVHSSEPVVHGHNMNSLFL